MKKPSPALNDLLRVMARLRSRTGCPWDREQDHRTLRWHAVAEVYELVDAIEAGDDHEMAEERGALVLLGGFHCQPARARGAARAAAAPRRACAGAGGQMEGRDNRTDRQTVS